MRLKLLLIGVFVCYCGHTFAQDYKNEIGLKSDNDAYLFISQDRYYTNGLFLNFRHATNQEKLGKRLEKFTYEVSVGQKMYNPISGNWPIQSRQDRPFAGYLFAGGNLNFFYKKESVLKIGAEFGTVGPDALGEEAQRLLHSTFGFYPINGWQYQITNDFAANLSAQYTQLLHRSEAKDLDFSLETYINAGTTFNGAGAGIVFRTGRINQLFNSSTTNSVISNKAKTEKFTKKEFFFYAKPQFNFVAYDATIQGSMFNNDSPVTFGVKRFVFAQQVGFDYSSARFTVDFSLLFKSKEVKSSAFADQYGMISLNYRLK
jgi:lipid A 3-O-deacylase